VSGRAGFSLSVALFISFNPEMETAKFFVLVPSMSPESVSHLDFPPAALSPPNLGHSDKPTRVFLALKTVF